MASDKASKNGTPSPEISAIFEEIARSGRQLSATEILVILEWMVECRDAQLRSDLLDLFEQARGLETLRAVLAPSH